MEEREHVSIERDIKSWSTGLKQNIAIRRVWWHPGVAAGAVLRLTSRKKVRKKRIDQKLVDRIQWQPDVVKMLRRVGILSCSNELGKCPACCQIQTYDDEYRMQE